MSISIFSHRRAAYLVLAFGILLGSMGLTYSGPLIKGAKEYTQEIAKSSATAYLSLRLINAAISFAEEVEVGGSIIAVNGSAQPFKVLEPIDDAVERLSAAIFLVGAVSGVLAVVLPVLGSVTLVLIGGSLAILAALALSRLDFVGRTFLTNFSLGTARLGVLGFSIVIAFSISSWFADGVSNSAWGEYERTLKSVAQQMPNLAYGGLSELDTHQESAPEEHAAIIEPEAIEAEKEKTGLLGKIGNGLKNTGDGVVNITSAAVAGMGDLTTSAVDGVKGAASSATMSYNNAKNILTVLTAQSDELVLSLMGVFAAFLFKTVVCPMLILAGLWKLLGSYEVIRRDEQATTY
tara:strand:- start:1872 stop:2921 length:1050 start_codon:yes stop_codon:yes gene_type:complete